MSVAEILFTSEGRIRRRDYWIWIIVTGLLWWLLILSAYGIWARDDSFWAAMAGAWQNPLSPFGLFFFVALGLVEWSRVCLNAKRWHDRNRSGWRAAVTSAAGLIYATAHGEFPALSVFPPPLPHYVLGLGLFLVYVWTFIECGCRAGTPGPNTYGPAVKPVKVIAEAEQV